MAFAMPAWAQLTAPALVLTDGTNTVSVDATGTVTMTPANCCTSVSVVLSAGSISWSGTIGNFTITNANGRTKPFAGLETAPTVDLGVGTVLTGAAGGTLNITWGDVGFTGLSTMALTQTTTIIGGSATFTGYVDNTNTLFGKGTLVGTISNVTSGGTSSTSGPGPSTQPFSITVIDTLNLPAGSFFTSDSQVLGTQYAPLTITCPTASAILGSAYSSSVTADGGVPPYSFSLSGSLPPGFTFNSSTGAITGTDSAATNTYNFAITVTDSVGNSTTTGTGGCNIVVTPKTPLSVACPTVTTGEVGAAYSSSLVAMGGIPAYTFSTNPAVFLPGLSLNSTTGAISGKPSSSGTFTFTAQVQDSNGNTAANTATANCTVTVTPPPTVNCSTSTTATTGEVGVLFTTPALSGSGGTSPYTYTLNGSPLPGGISTVNSSTGVVSGTPTSTGSFNVGLKDNAGVVAANSCPYTVIAAPTVTCAAVTSGEVGAAFNAPSLTVTGGTAPYMFAVASGTLPAGLILNTTTGAITGTPTAAGTFSLKVTDADGAMVTVSCPYTIVSAPTLSCSAVSGEVGQGITSAAPTVSGGTAPFTFAVASGAVPAGLTLNSSTGAVTGTATAAGSFTLKVTDANGVSASGSCPFTISAAPVLTCSTNNQLTIGVAYTGAALTVSGGVAPYTFSVSGTLPAGLTLNASTGAITGTPTATGSFSIHVTDALGATTSTCVYNVNPAGNTGQGTLSAKCASTTAQVGTAYNSSIVASGGSGSYTYAVVTGSLPNGLTLNASTGAITGTPTAAGTVGFSIQVTDTVSKATTIATCATSCGVTITTPSVTYVPLTSYYNVWAAWTDGSSPQHGGLDCYGYGWSLSANAVPVSGGTTPLSTFLTPNAPSAVTSVTIPLNGSATSLSFLATAQYGAQVNQPFVVTYTDGSSQTFTQSLSDWGAPQGFSGESLWESFPYRLTPQGQQQAGPWNMYQYTFTLNSAKSLKSITLPNNQCVDVYRVWTSTLSNNVSLSSYYNANGVVTTGNTAGNGGLDGHGYAFDGDASPSFCGQQLRNVCPKDTADVVQAKGQAITLTGNATSVTFLATSVCGTQSNQTFTVTYTDGTTTTFTTNIDGTSSYSGSNGQTCWGAYSSSGVKINQYTFALNSAKTLKSFTLPNNQCVDILQIQLANATSTVGDCSIVVAPAPPKVTCGSCSGNSSTTQVGQSYSSQLDVSSGVAPFTFRITSGSLPAGLTLNATTGVVSGKPTQPGTYTFTTTVTDSTGATATATCTIVVQGCPIQVTCGSCSNNTNVQVGEHYSSTIGVSGGSGSYQIKVIAGAIPAGLTLNSSNGAITGTLTTAGDWYFQTQVTDTWGDTAVTTCSINVVAPIHLDPGNCTQQNVGKCGQNYQAQPNCNGGTGGYQFSLCKGYSLPWGLNLDPHTGIISGKPNLPCNQTVAIQVCDSAGHTTTTNCTIAATK
jgi:hypothetical protein